MESTAKRNVIVPAELSALVQKPTLDDDDDTALKCFEDIIAAVWNGGGVDEHDGNKINTKRRIGQSTVITGAYPSLVMPARRSSNHRWPP